MSSQIHISMIALSSNPKVTVMLQSEEVKDDREACGYHIANTAKVDFAGKDCLMFDYYFDEGKQLMLTRDFTYFRHEETNSYLMRLLYEHGISFTVHH